MCSRITKAELKSLDKLRTIILNTETRQAFEDLYMLIADETIKGDEIVMENRYHMGNMERFHKLIQLGAIDWHVPLQTSVEIAKARQTGNGPRLLELVDQLLESEQERTGGGAIYLFKKKKKKPKAQETKKDRESKALRQTEQRAWRTTLKILNPANTDSTVSEQLRRSMATMLKETQSFCILLRSVVKETPAFVGYLLLVDSKWGYQNPPPEANNIYQQLSIKEIRQSVLEAMSR